MKQLRSFIESMHFKLTLSFLGAVIISLFFFQLSTSLTLDQGNLFTPQSQQFFFASQLQGSSTEAAFYLKPPLDQPTLQTWLKHIVEARAFQKDMPVHRRRQSAGHDHRGLQQWGAAPGRLALFATTAHGGGTDATRSPLTGTICPREERGNHVRSDDICGHTYTGESEAYSRSALPQSKRRRSLEHPDHRHAYFPCHGPLLSPPYAPDRYFHVCPSLLLFISF